MFQFGKYFKSGPLGITFFFYTGLSPAKRTFFDAQWIKRAVSQTFSFYTVTFYSSSFIDIIHMYRNNTNNSKNKQTDNNNNNKDNEAKQNNNIFSWEGNHL